MNAFVSLGASQRQQLSLQPPMPSSVTNGAHVLAGLPGTTSGGALSDGAGRLMSAPCAEAIADGLKVLEAANAGIFRLQNHITEAIDVLEQARRLTVRTVGRVSVTSRAIQNDGVPVTERNLLGVGTSTAGQLTSSGHAIGAFSESMLVSDLSPPIVSADTLMVNGKSISFDAPAGNEISAAGAALNAGTATVRLVLDAIEAISGGKAWVNGDGHITITSSAWTPTILVGSALIGLGFAPDCQTVVTAVPIGNTLTISMVGDDAALVVAFGDGCIGTVKTLAQLNNALSAKHLHATLDSSGRLTVATTPGSHESSGIAWIGGTIVTAEAGAFHEIAASLRVADTETQADRAELLSRYDTIRMAIDHDAAGYAATGLSLLCGDDLSVLFDEKAKAKLHITGIRASSGDLGLSQLTETDIADSSAVIATLKTLRIAGSMLRRAALDFGSGLIVVQARHDLNTRLIALLEVSSGRPRPSLGEEASNLKALQDNQSRKSSECRWMREAQRGALQFLKRPDGYYR